MAETQETTTNLAGQPGREALAAFGRELVGAVEGLSAHLKAATKRASEQQEAGALFELYRQLREVDGWRDRTQAEREARRVELNGMIRTALDGYSTAFLSDLIVVAEAVTHDAKPIWAARTR